MRIDYQASPQRKSQSETRKDAIIQQLQSASPAQIDSWIENNVNDLDDAKRVLKALAKGVVLLLKQYN
ncbi:MAG: hypothetical protein OET90_02600 [Desulfuromonadales bacterium]|nr:hypothetical protein [Desulfuromonadales bacterium]